MTPLSQVDRQATSLLEAIFNAQGPLCDLQSGVQLASGLQLEVWKVFSAVESAWMGWSQTVV